MAKHNWADLKVKFCTDPAMPTVGEFAGKRGMGEKTVQNRAAAERWIEARREHWEKVGKKSGAEIEGLQVTITARDISQKLSQIQAMKMTALKYAGGAGMAVIYDKPGDAVSAYEKLEKLERLILGESTEHIQVTDARAYVREVLAIVREEVMQHDILERIAQRVTGLSLGQRSDSGAAGLN